MAKEGQTVEEFLLETIGPSLLEQPLNPDTKWDLRTRLLDVAKVLARELQDCTKCSCGCVFKTTKSLLCPSCQKVPSLFDS